MGIWDARQADGPVHGFTEPNEERESHANKFCKKACEESGVKVDSWGNFKGWNEFVDGKIGEDQLAEKARDEMNAFAGIFGKYVVIDKSEENKHHREEEERKTRAKQAGKIYRKVCGDTGLRVYFFHDFKSWSDYVEGKISEEEFYERAREEVAKIAAPPEGSATR